ncbi:MAG: glycoside hydrolase [Verrucomicrobiales bacterium]|nr:glycoside hydrolase [Verrucomicrobiales bacterium]
MPVFDMNRIIRKIEIQLRFLAILFFLFGTMPCWATSKPNTGPWSVSSPDSKCQIAVSLNENGQPTCQVKRGHSVVLPPSPLGLECDDESFHQSLKLGSLGKIETKRETYELFTGNRTHVDTLLSIRTLTLFNSNGAPILIDLAASNEGVAFRYRFADRTNKVRIVRSELTGFTIPPETKGWLQPYHAAGQYTPAYEDYYFHVTPRDAPPQIRAKAIGWSFPALFQLTQNHGWILLTESGTDASYCACHLSTASSNGLYRIAFPAADEATRGQTSNIGPEPRSTTPWTMPWRVIVLGDSPAQIAMSTLVTDLATPSQVRDTSWIHPGRASWSWWSYPEGPNTIERYNHFTDFSAAMGWEYTLFDGGWWEAGLKPIAEHARTNGVASFAWSFAGDFYDPAPRQRKLNELKHEGATGVKVDFWCSDRQEAIAAMIGLFQDAAARKMAVSLHGCTLPRGWQRTWPNFLTAEAVLGSESYFYEQTFPERAAELNTILPFTRNAVGPMDFTPIACSPKKYPRQTTAAHELATALVFTSGFICYADKPEFFRTLPEAAVQILRDAPGRWDESKCVIGDPGRLAVFARRSGKSWFIAGLNGTREPLPIKLDLRSFPQTHHATLIEEGAEPKMQVSAETFSRPKAWTHKIPGQGGFILRLDP